MSELRVLITGASSGIGAELARVFAKRQHALVLVARREELLADLAVALHSQYGVQVLPISMDLSKSRAPEQLMRRIAKEDIQLEVLVNNAGVAKSGRFTQMEQDAVKSMLALNIGALTRLTHLVLPGMLARNTGRILNVASVVAFQPVPSLAVYAATKAFVLSFSEALSEELKGSGVTVATLCPGLTRTEMAQDLPSSDTLPSFMVASAADVAEEGYQACMRGEVIRVPGAVNRMAVAWSELQPRWLVRTVAGYMGRMSLQQNDQK